MKICIAGGTGLIGGAVKTEAEAAGHQVTVIHVPRPPKASAHEPTAWKKVLAAWQPETFSGFTAVMFFGGEPINNRWSDRKRQRIELSRQMPCRRMAECAAAAESRPRTIISASATGYYGDKGEQTVTEDSKAGKGFLAPTTATWEATWESARNTGIRVVPLRFGVVLSPHGGALKMMLPAFKLGLGGPMGGGQQWMPWITDKDAARLAVYCLEEDDLRGPVNAVTPQPVRQVDFARALGNALNRPAIIPLPGKALRLAYGMMARETILASCRAVPAKAVEEGFHFAHPEINEALRFLLKE